MSAKKSTTKKAPKAQAAKEALSKKTEPQANETNVETTADAKPAKAQQPAKEKVPGKLSVLDAAAKVLAESGEPMSAKAMVEVMGTKGYWTSPGGQTPHATLYAAVLREIQKKGAEARFQKVDRGQFALCTAAAPVTPKKSKKAMTTKPQEAEATTEITEPGE